MHVHTWTVESIGSLCCTIKSLVPHCSSLSVSISATLALLLPLTQSIKLRSKARFQFIPLNGFLHLRHQFYAFHKTAKKPVKSFWHCRAVCVIRPTVSSKTWIKMRKFLHLCPELMMNCFVPSQTMQLLWSKLFLCPHLSLQISNEWTFSSIAAHFSTSVSLCFLRRREDCLC